MGWFFYRLLTDKTIRIDGALSEIPLSSNGNSARHLDWPMNGLDLKSDSH